MASGECDLELMRQSGCVKCVHFAECSSDALACEGFSTLDLGMRCKGYEETKGKEKVQWQSELTFAT